MGDRMTLEEIKEEMKLRHKKKKHPESVKQKNFFTKYISKMFITIILTLGVLILLKQNKKFETFFYEKVYDTHFNFSKLNQTYQKYFGSSIPFSGIVNNDTKTVFQENLVYTKREKYEEGVKLTVDKEYLVPVMDSGMVVFIGEKEKYGKTVIVQQVNGVDVWYSSLENVSVKLYDYVEKGSLLGDVSENTLILVFKKDGKILDYEKQLS